MPDDFSQSLRVIDDELTREMHRYVRASDEVLYWLEYTSGRDYSYSANNQLISNLKKSPTKPAAELYWKTQAIGRTSRYFSAALSHDWLKVATLVPIPCSKKKDDPEYDDRMTRICRGITCGADIDVRELVYVTASMEAAHARQANNRPRPTVAELEAVYRIDEAVANPTPRIIGIFDDVLTAGTHFRAMSNVLNACYPGVPIVGIFVARRVKPPIVFDDLTAAP